MAQFTVTLNAKINLPPSALGINTIYLGDPTETGVLTIDDFTDTVPPYTDPEGDAPYQIKVLTIPTPTQGILTFDGVPVAANDVILVSDMLIKDLIFTPVTTFGSYNTEMTFDISDVGSATFSGLQGTLYFNIGEPLNSPATIGDGEATIEYASSLVFTRAMFTSATTPPYSDPEGDQADKLKILSLPVDGRLLLVGTPVVVNQVIDFIDIDAGDLIYSSDLDDTDGDIETFEFAIADAGSGIFVT